MVDSARSLSLAERKKYEKVSNRLDHCDQLSV